LLWCHREQGSLGRDAIQSRGDAHRADERGGGENKRHHGEPSLRLIMMFSVTLARAPRDDPRDGPS